MAGRVREGLLALVQAKPGIRAALVTHRMPIAAAAELCEPGGAVIVPGACPNGSITTLRVEEDDRFRLVAWCDERIAAP